MDTSALLYLAIQASLAAGEEIMKVYKTDFSYETKSDNTPVTLADKAASQSIIKHLSVSKIPSISEEEPLPEFETRKNWKRVWIIDPLDGTKEFIKRSGEFTVNIALIENQKPVIGVIYAPVLNCLYFASKEKGSFMANGNTFYLNQPANELFSNSKKLPLQQTPAQYTMVASRSHLSREINIRLGQLQNLYGEVALLHAGSSIKQCWVAEGRAHEYSRLGATMEWDTAAGQCILENAGGCLNTLEDNLPLKYNKKNPENPYFIARSHN